MDESSEMAVVADSHDQARLSRRRALKAAAATGAGIGVLSIVGPQVGVLGTAPAYAVGCSKSDSATVSGSVNCGSGCSSNEISLNQAAGNTVLQLGNVTVTVANLGGHCTNDPLPITYSGGTGVSCTAVITVVGGPGAVTLPAVIPKKQNGGSTGPNASYCNSTWSMVITCVGTDC